MAIGLALNLTVICARQEPSFDSLINDEHGSLQFGHGRAVLSVSVDRIDRAI
jgi:hypothetical protein